MTVDSDWTAALTAASRRVRWRAKAQALKRNCLGGQNSSIFAFADCKIQLQRLCVTKKWRRYFDTLPVLRNPLNPCHGDLFRALSTSSGTFRYGRHHRRLCPHFGAHAAAVSACS